MPNRDNHAVFEAQCQHENTTVCLSRAVSKLLSFEVLYKSNTMYLQQKQLWAHQTEI